MLHRLCNETPAVVQAAAVTGHYLALNRLDARGRARLAADIIDGRVEIAEHTVEQITRLCRSNRLYVAEARDPGRARRLRQRRLQRAWDAVNPDHRAEFCRSVGIEQIWTVLAEAIG